MNNTIAVTAYGMCDGDTVIGAEPHARRKGMATKLAAGQGRSGEQALPSCVV